MNEKSEQIAKQARLDALIDGIIYNLNDLHLEIDENKIREVLKDLKDDEALMAFNFVIGSIKGGAPNDFAKENEKFLVNKGFFESVHFQGGFVYKRSDIEKIGLNVEELTKEGYIEFYDAEKLRKEEEKTWKDNVFYREGFREGFEEANKKYDDDDE